MHNPYNDDWQPSHQDAAAANQLMHEALARRERFLDRHPHLRVYQAEIDRVLDQSGTRQGRMAVLGTMMQGKLLDMQSELYKLTHLLQQAVDVR
ncbi:MAG: hypothetical protein WBY88_08040 [Desulfosarcina sp.]